MQRIVQRWTLVVVVVVEKLDNRFQDCYYRYRNGTGTANALSTATAGRTITFGSTPSEPVSFSNGGQHVHIRTILNLSNAIHPSINVVHD